MLEGAPRVRDYPTFLGLLTELETAMQSIVNDYYPSFNASIHTFSDVVGALAGTLSVQADTAKVER